MSRTVNGTSGILAAARVICRLFKRFGGIGLAAGTSPEFELAVATFVLACDALHTLDDQPYVVDTHAPFGTEDVMPA